MTDLSQPDDQLTSTQGGDDSSVKALKEPTAAEEKTVPLSSPPVVEERKASEKDIKGRLASLGIKPSGLGESPRPQKSKVVLAVVAVLFLLASVPAGVYLVKQRQEVRKAAKILISDYCKDGWDTCQLSPYNCNNPTRASHELWDSCGEERPSDYIGQFFGLSKATGSCENGEHVLRVTVKKRDPSQEIVLHTKTKYCTCNEPCAGRDANGICACASNCSEESQNVTIPSGTANQEIVRKWPMVKGGCGSSQIDMQIDTFTVNGNSKNCALRSWEIGPGTIAWSLWLSGQELSVCEGTPIYVLACESLAAYDGNWNPISNLSSLAVGNEVNFVVNGATSEPQGITSARFRVIIDGTAGSWQTSPGRPPEDGGFYFNYIIPKGGHYRIEAEVCNPSLGCK